MSGLLETVDKRTQMVGQNRLELLLFRLNGDQQYGINVFKVREVLRCPKLTSLPKRHDVVRGVAHIRGGTIPVMDMSLAVGGPAMENIDDCFVIITEYNMNIQGFMVHSVENIINTNWEDIHPPPKGTGKQSYLTAVTQVGDRLVEIIDVEKILAEVSPMRHEVSAGIVTEEVVTVAQQQQFNVLVVDDSSVARKQVIRCLQSVGVQIHELSDGLQAIKHLRKLADDGKDVTKEYILIISDIEMPEMDGYTLTSEIRKDPRLSQLYVLLHTSLSGVFNEALVKKVGANDFLAKFRPDDLAAKVSERVRVNMPKA